jgi:hypothetical protein
VWETILVQCTQTINHYINSQISGAYCSITLFFNVLEITGVQGNSFEIITLQVDYAG